MTIQSNRSLGGYGACLVALSVISTVISLFQDFLPKSLGVSLVLSGISGIVGLLAIVGIILLLLAMSGFSREYKEPRIMNYIWTAIIIIIIGIVIIFAIAFVFLLSNIFSIIPNMSSTTSTQIASLTTRWLAPFLPIAGLVGLISILYVMRSLNLLSDKSEVSLFKVAGKVAFGAPSHSREMI